MHSAVKTYLLEAPALETARLRLRVHRADDLEECAAMWAEEGVTRFISGKPLTKEETWLRILRHAGHWALLGYGYWAVEEKETGKLLGEAGLADFRRDFTVDPNPPISGIPEAGWVFAGTAHGKGYASEAMQAILSWGEGHFGNDRSVCLINPKNTSSLRLAQPPRLQRRVKSHLPQQSDNHSRPRQQIMSS